MLAKNVIIAANTKLEGSSCYISMDNVAFESQLL